VSTFVLVVGAVVVVFALSITWFNLTRRF